MMEDETIASSRTIEDRCDDGFGVLQDVFFRNYVVAFLFSMTGMFVRVTAMGYLVYDITGDPFRLGLMSFAQVAPEIIFGPVAAAWLDRIDRRRLLILNQLVYLIAMLTIISLMISDHLEYWHLLVIGASMGIAASFDWPARMALVPTLVPRRHLQSAVAINAAMFNGARVVGPSLGGFLIGAIGVAACFGVYSVSLLPYVALLLFMPHDRRPVVHSTDQSPWQGLMEGYRYILNHKPIRAMLSVDIIPIMLGMSYITMAPAFARDVLHMGSAGLGLLLSGNGLGSLIGTLLVARLHSVRHRGMVVSVGVALFGVMLVAFEASGSLAVSLPLIVIVGLVYAVYSTMNDTLIQTTVDDAFRGRVSATYSMIWGLSPIGGLIAGWIASKADVQWAIIVCGLLVLLYVPYLWLATPLRTVS